MLTKYKYKYIIYLYYIYKGDLNMNINEEKQYLYSMMSDVTQERRKLTDIYHSLKERLDELNTLEIKGLEELSLSGYVDLHNKRSKEVKIANISREMNRAIDVVEESFNPKVEEVIPKYEIDIDKEIEHKEKPVVKSGQFNLDKAVGVVAMILKESGKPMKAKNIYKEICETTNYNVSLSNFTNNILPKICKKNKKVNRAMRGYYQYSNSI